MEEPSTPLWPLAVYFMAVLVVVASMLGLSYLLGPRHREPATGQPYESGVRTVGSARLRFAPRFYLIAMFFLIFDLESVFIFAWAVAAREAGWPGYIEILIFIGILLVALIYLWKVGALEQGGRTVGHRPHALQIGDQTGQPGDWRLHREPEGRMESTERSG